MKRTALFTFTLFLLAIMYSSCKEDVYMDWKLMNDRWYATFKDSLKDTNFHVTTSGLYYKIKHQGYQRHPNPGDYANIKYRGSLVNGSVFDESTIWLELTTKGTIKGLNEGIPKMQDGGHYVFYIPSTLAYDTATTLAKIPPHSVLRFDVELLKSN